MFLKHVKTPVFLPKSLRRMQTSLPAFYTLVLLHLLLTRNFQLKLQANISPVFKKGERYSKGNYRPVSILPNVSKIFGRCMFRQKNEYIDVLLSRNQRGFRKDCSTQQCLLTMLEKWISAVDNKKKNTGSIINRNV